MYLCIVRRLNRKFQNSPEWNRASSFPAYAWTSSPARPSYLLEGEEPFQLLRPLVRPERLFHSLRPSLFHLQLGSQEEKHNSTAVSSRFDAYVFGRLDLQPSEELGHFFSFPFLGP